MHTLETPWTVWFSESAPNRYGKQALSKGKYLSELHQLFNLKSVEEFVDFWDACNRPEDMKDGVNVFMFRQGCKPAWEELPYGCTWTIRIDKSTEFKADAAWEKLFLACIGEVLPSTDVAGCSMSCRPTQWVLSVWLGSQHDKFAVLESVKALLELPEDTIIDFKEHQQVMIDSNSGKRYSIKASC